MNRKRVVVTGLSAISPIGANVTETWDNLLAGKSGIAPVTLFDASEFTSKIAGEVKNFMPEQYGMNPKQTRKLDRFSQFAVAAGNMLMQDSGYTVTEKNAERLGVLLGIGLGGISTMESSHSKLLSSGPNRVTPFTIPMMIANMGPGHIAIAVGAKGPNYVVTSACASSTHAIGMAYTDIVMGRCDAIITGGVEATITPLGMSGFTALKALSTAHNDDPEKASRPFEKNRDGFVMGEGTGLLLLESLDHALERGAKIYAEIVGTGASCDAFHMTAPREDAEGMIASMRRALQDAELTPECVTHINAHGTSTHLNDLCETRAIRAVFGKHAEDIAISATKSQTGHLLGAAGGIEAIFSVLALHTGIIPGTINYETPDPECDLNYMGSGSEKLNPEYVMSNSFGFGGTNGSLIFKRYDG
ncbi:MAG: beta-ketoacyl-ACP synthase II [Desulfovibrionaceae bacterium]|nr:beta-ketoacyl-ACP synthase II [Desulfovibrionaceae bacterium]